MIYDIAGLTCDVMARLGEKRQICGGMPFTTIAEAVELKVKSLLPPVGKRLMVGAPVLDCGGWKTSVICGDLEVTMLKMPCGLYACDIPLPEDAVRILSVRMEGWTRSATRVILPDDPDWECQWSAEPGIAGCPERPQAYLQSEDPLRLRCLGSESADDALATLLFLQIPNPDEDGKFRFPAALYPELISEIVKELG